MKYSKLFTSISLATAFVSSVTLAAVPNTFSAGSPAKAAEVNANFSSVDAAATAAQTSANEAKTSANTAQTSATSALEKANTVEASVTTLSSTVSTNGNDITTINGQIAALDTAVTAVEDGITTVNGQVSSLETALTNLSTSIAPNSMVELDVDCTDDSKALVDAYAANAMATSLTFNLTGNCEGDFQGLPTTVFGEVIAPNTANLTLKGGDAGASISANTESGVVNIVAANAKLIIDNVDIVIGSDEEYPILIIDNATAQISNVGMTGNTNTSLTLISVRGSSSLDASNLTLNTAANAIRVYDGSHANLTDITSINANTGVKVSASSASFFGTHSLGRINITTGSGVTFGDGDITTDQLSLYNSSLLQGSTSVLTVNGKVSVDAGSNFVSRNLSVTTGDFYVATGSSYYANGSLVMAVESKLNVREGSSARIRAGSSYGIVIYDVDLRSKGILILDGVDGAYIQVNGSVDVKNSDLQSVYTTFHDNINAEINSSLALGVGQVLGTFSLTQSDLKAQYMEFYDSFTAINASSVDLADGSVGSTEIRLSTLASNSMTFSEIHLHTASSAVLQDSTITGGTDIDVSRVAGYDTTFTEEVSLEGDATLVITGTSTMLGGSVVNDSSQLIDYSETSI